MVWFLGWFGLGFLGWLVFYTTKERKATLRAPGGDPARGASQGALWMGGLVGGLGIKKKKFFGSLLG